LPTPNYLIPCRQLNLTLHPLLRLFNKTTLIQLHNGWF